MTHTQNPDIQLRYEVREPLIFIYGSWFLGELKVSFNELGKFTRESNYQDVSSLDESDTVEHNESLSCRSCKESNSVDQSCILSIGSEELIICYDCRDTLISVICEIQTKYATQIASHIV